MIVDRIATFGPIDWAEYYGARRDATPLRPTATLPCLTCGRCVRCNAGTLQALCTRYKDWVRRWWPIVTGRERMIEE